MLEEGERGEITCDTDKGDDWEDVSRMIEEGKQIVICSLKYCIRSCGAESLPHYQEATM